MLNSSHRFVRQTSRNSTLPAKLAHGLTATQDAQKKLLLNFVKHTTATKTACNKKRTAKAVRFLLLFYPFLLCGVRPKALPFEIPQFGENLIKYFVFGFL